MPFLPFVKKGQYISLIRKNCLTLQVTRTIKIKKWALHR
jgi:hypothetical protein